MGLLTPAAFLSALPALFQGTQSKGSLYLTVKRGACRQSMRVYRV